MHNVKWLISNYFACCMGQVLQQQKKADLETLNSRWKNLEKKIRKCQQPIFMDKHAKNAAPQDCPLWRVEVCIRDNTSSFKTNVWKQMYRHSHLTFCPIMNHLFTGF